MRGKFGPFLQNIGFFSQNEYFLLKFDKKSDFCKKLTKYLIMFTSISLGGMCVDFFYWGLINVKNIDGNLKTVKNVFRRILIMTNMYVKVKPHKGGLNLIFICWVFSWGIFHFWGRFFMG